MENVNKKKTFIIVFITCLTFFAIGLVCYDKFFNKEKPPVPTPTPEVTNNINDNIITNFNKIEITDENQVANVDGKEYKIKREITVDGAYLLIDDVVVDVDGDTTVYADNAYVTNKYILFTNPGQDGEIISYAIDKNGKQITVNDNEYQMHDLVLEDGILMAKGHIFCGLDGDCPDKDLIIKYENNIITVNIKE